MLEYCREQIIDYENILLCTFGKLDSASHEFHLALFAGFVLNVRQPYCLIEEWVAEFGGRDGLSLSYATTVDHFILASLQDVGNWNAWQALWRRRGNAFR